MGEPGQRKNGENGELAMGMDIGPPKNPHPHFADEGNWSSAKDRRLWIGEYWGDLP